jgi:hypothetical protein
MSSFASASAWSSAGALAVVYAGGYLVGSLLVARTEELSFAIVRTVAGLNADWHRVSVFPRALLSLVRSTLRASHDSSGLEQRWRGLAFPDRGQ